MYVHCIIRVTHLTFFFARDSAKLITITFGLGDVGAYTKLFQSYLMVVEYCARFVKLRLNFTIVPPNGSPYETVVCNVKCNCR